MISAQKPENSYLFTCVPNLWPCLAGLVRVGRPPPDARVPGALDLHDDLDLAEVPEDAPHQGEGGGQLALGVQALLDRLGLESRL